MQCTALTLHPKTANQQYRFLRSLELHTSTDTMAFFGLLSLVPSDTCPVYGDILIYGMLLASVFVMVATCVVVMVWGDTICAPLPPFPLIMDTAIEQPDRLNVKV